jgi:arylsulfatase A-like enzyme
VLAGDDTTGRPSLLIEYKTTPSFPFHTAADVRRIIERGGGADGFVPDYRSVRSLKWQYVEWYAGDAHEYELYDMTEDPYQLTNLLADPDSAADHADVVSQLQARLEDLAACSGANCR